MKPYIPIFIINLKKDTEKKQYMQELCKKYSLECQFIDAVYGKELSKETLSKIYNKKEAIHEFSRELTKGEIGCALSHINIYKQMIEKNIEKAIIFEDDIQIEEGFSSVINNISQFPKDWELVLLGYYSHTSSERCTKASLRYRKKITGSHYTVRLIEKAYGTHGYIINLNGAKKLMSHFPYITKPIDHYTMNDNIINLYAIFPRIVKLAKKYSAQGGIETARLQMESKYKKTPINKIQRELIRPFKQIINKIKLSYDYVKTLKRYT